MTQKLTITEAAHTWGFDHFRAVPNSPEAARLGEITGTTLHEPPKVEPGDAMAFRVDWSNGFSTHALATAVTDVTLDLHTQSLVQMHTNQTLWHISGELVLNNQFAPEVAGYPLAYPANVPLEIEGNSYGNIVAGRTYGTTFDGNGGVDTFVVAGTRGEFSLTASNGAMVLARTQDDGRPASRLIEVERIQFSDVALAWDVQGSVGQAYRLYEAALDRAPDAAGLGYHVNALDQGWSLAAVAQTFIASPEFQQNYGALNDRQFVEQLYQNVLERSGESAGVDYHVGRLASGVTRADILVGFAESPENQATVNGTVEAGVVYTPYG